MPRKPSQQFAEDGISVIVAVDDDVVRRQVIERFRRPLGVGMVLDKLPRQRDVGVGLARATNRCEIEVACLGLTAGSLDVRLKKLPRLAEAIEVIGAFSKPQRDQFFIVTAGDTKKRVEAGARLCPAPAIEKQLRPGQLALKLIGRDERNCFDTGDSILRIHRLCAERVLVVHTAVRLERVLDMATRFFGPSERDQHVFGTTQLAVAQVLEQIFRAAGIAALQRNVG
jgi:hypothetical protein